MNVAPRALFRQAGSRTAPGAGGCRNGSVLDFFRHIQDSPGVSEIATAGGRQFNTLLQQTSRSFHLTLRVLPRAIRFPISLAYLLARTTDTIADTEIVPVNQRLEILRQLRARILTAAATPLRLEFPEPWTGNPAERRLLAEVEFTLGALQELTDADLGRVRQVLAIIISGQELDLRRFEGASRANIIPLPNAAALEDYTYRVAGCVGEFWTTMCRAHLFPHARLDDDQLLAQAVQFGQGLQLVNILRDLPGDLQNGRCYVPADQLAARGLQPDDLLSPAQEEKLRPVYHHWLDRAESQLRAGWAYTNSIPRCQIRVRLACAWPILIGLKTLTRLRCGTILTGGRVKVPRSEVRRIVAQTIIYYPFAGLWRNLAGSAHETRPAAPKSGR